MRATVADGNLRNLVLAQLIEQNVQEQRALVVPTGALLHQVDEEVFSEYKTTLAGVTQHNMGSIKSKLADLGVDSRGRVLSRETQSPVPAGFKRESTPGKCAAGTQSHVREHLASIVGVFENLLATEEK